MDTPDRHTIPRRPIAIPDDEWEELGKLVGDRNRTAVVRGFVRALLKRPGAKMPRRADFEQPKD